MAVSTDTVSRPSTRLYAWTVDGAPSTGTLADYASALEHAHYDGIETSALYHVIVVEVPWGSQPALVEVVPDRTVTEGPDFQHVVLSHGDQDAHFRVDLRA